MWIILDGNHFEYNGMIVNEEKLCINIFISNYNKKDIVKIYFNKKEDYISNLEKIITNHTNNNKILEIVNYNDYTFETID